MRSALNQQRLVDPASPYRLPAVHLVLALAHDVACAMLHLHSEQIVHSDLKASNVLLTKANTFAPFTAALESSDHEANSSNSSARSKPDSCAVLLAAAQALAGGRLVAKVADFGLSLALDPESTHISHMHAVSACCLENSKPDRATLVATNVNSAAYTDTTGIHVGRELQLSPHPRVRAQSTHLSGTPVLCRCLCCAGHIDAYGSRAAPAWTSQQG